MDEILNTYLTFKLGTESFAVDVAKVQEIKEYTEPRKIPESTKFMAGVIKYREEVIPVIDTGLKFGLKPVELSVQTCIIVIDIEREANDSNFRIGILADAVTDIIELTDNNLGTFDKDYRPEYILGTCTVNENFHIILNIDKIFSLNEVIKMSAEIKKIK